MQVNRGLEADKTRGALQRLVHRRCITIGVDVRGTGRREVGMGGLLGLEGRIADLEEADTISADAVGEAIQYRTLDRNLWQ